MSTKLQLRVTAASFAAALCVLSPHSALAGGDLIPVAPVEKPRTVSSWTGLSIGGGIGVQKLGADVGVDSLSKSRAADYACGEKIDNAFGKGKINDPDPVKAAGRFDFAWKCLLKNDAAGTGTYNHMSLGHHLADYAFSEQIEVDGDWKAFGTVQVGYDYQITKKLVLGGFANVDFGTVDADFSVSHTGPTTGNPRIQGGRAFKHNSSKDKFADYGPVGSDISGSLETDLSVTVGGRLGVLLSDKTLAYGLAGYTRTELSGTVGFALQDQYVSVANKSNKFLPVNLSEKFNETLHGVTVGVGAEHKLNDRWSIKAEYRYTWLGEIQKKLSKQAFSDDSVVNGGGYKTWQRSIDSETTFDIDPHVNSFRLLMTYKFN